MYLFITSKGKIVAYEDFESMGVAALAYRRKLEKDLKTTIHVFTSVGGDNPKLDKLTIK